VFGSGVASNYAIAYAPRADGLRVTARPIGVAALAGQAKLVGRPDPVFGYAVTSGSVVPGDAFAGSLVRAPGEVPGAYPIEQGTLSLGTNYAIAYTGAPFNVANDLDIALIDRAPRVGGPGAAALADLLAALPPTAAGPANAADAAVACVRELSLGGGGAAAQRSIVNRGLRLPQGVTDPCRPAGDSGAP
jgi:hypothetical protein